MVVGVVAGLLPLVGFTGREVWVKSPAKFCVLPLGKLPSVVLAVPTVPPLAEERREAATEPVETICV